MKQNFLDLLKAAQKAEAAGAARSASPSLVARTLTPPTGSRPGSPLLQRSSSGTGGGGSGLLMPAKWRKIMMNRAEKPSLSRRSSIASQGETPFVRRSSQLSETAQDPFMKAFFGYSTSLTSLRSAISTNSSQAGSIRDEDESFANDRSALKIPVWMRKALFGELEEEEGEEARGDLDDEEIERPLRPSERAAVLGALPMEKWSEWMAEEWMRTGSGSGKVGKRVDAEAEKSIFVSSLPADSPLHHGFLVDHKDATVSWLKTLLPAMGNRLSTTDRPPVPRSLEWLASLRRMDEAIRWMPPEKHPLYLQKTVEMTAGRSNVDLRPPPPKMASHELDEEDVGEPQGTEVGSTKAGVQNRKGIEDGFGFDVMMALDEGSIEAVRADFEAVDGKALSLPQFVYVMYAYIGEELREVVRGGRVELHDDREEERVVKPVRFEEMDKDVVAGLVELFGEIDVNGDGALEWDEFTTFLIRTSGVFCGQGGEDLGELRRDFQYSGLLDTEEARVRRSFVGRHGVAPLNELVYVKGPELLIACGKNKMVYAYDPFTEELVQELKGHNNSVLTAVMIPCNPPVLATSGGDSAIMLWEWNAATMRFLRLKTVLVQAPATALAVSEDGSRLYAGLLTGSALVYQTSDWKRIGALEVANDMITSAIELTGSSVGLVAMCSLDGGLRVVDMDSLKVVKDLVGHTRGIFCLEYAEDFKLILAGGVERDVFVWNPLTGQRVFRARGHQFPVVGIEVIPSTSKYVSGDARGVFRVTDLKTFVTLQEFKAPDRGLTGLSSWALCRDQRLVAGNKDLYMFVRDEPGNPRESDRHAINGVVYAGSQAAFLHAAHRSIRVWDARTGKLRLVLRDLVEHVVTAIILDGRERKFIIGTSGGEVSVFNLSTGVLLRRVMEPGSGRGEVRSLAYVNEGHVLVVGDESGVTAWNEDTGERLRTMAGGGNCGGVIVDDVLGLTFGIVGGDWYKWHMLSGRVKSRGSAAEGRTYMSLVLCEPGGEIALSDDAGGLEVWKAGGKEPVVRASNFFQGSRVSPVLVLAWDEDGLELYSGDDSGTVKVWSGSIVKGDVRVTRRWRAHGESIAALEVVGDGLGVVTAGWDRKIRVWSCGGDFYGTLHQGTVAGASWRFPWPVEAMIEEEESAVGGWLRSRDGDDDDCHVGAEEEEEAEEAGSCEQLHEDLPSRPVFDSAGSVARDMYERGLMAPPVMLPEYELLVHGNRRRTKGSAASETKMLSRQYAAMAVSLEDEARAERESKTRGRLELMAVGKSVVKKGAAAKRVR